MKDSCCVRGRHGAIHSPGHWTRDLLRLPPIAAELPEEFEQSFLIGKPWFFGEHEFLTEQCILMYFIVVPPSMFSRFTSSCTCLLSFLL